MESGYFPNTTGLVFNIQKFCTDDGPGIRTTVFLKGCHLRCSWCHNPEGLTQAPLLEFKAMDCVLCGRCQAVCPNGVHSFSGDSHLIDRNKCTGCGLCVDACEFKALSLCGKTMTAQEVLDIALADRDFYFPDGGITLSGGEPLLQPDFVLALGTLAKQEGIHVCVETSGAFPFSVFEKILPVVDLFLFDIKETDRDNHLRHTRIPNDLPLENIRKLDALGKPFVIRCPIIPGVNDRKEHFDALAELYVSLKFAQGIQIMPYHRLGQGKTTRFGATSEEFRIPMPEEVTHWNQLLKDSITNYQTGGSICSTV